MQMDGSGCIGESEVSEFHYKWTLKDAIFTKDKGKVFSCFACGGGSTMGYKLAGFDVIGCNEIDPKMIEVYKLNHKPKYAFLESIQTFKNRKDLPKELYELDILDGSPPCSSFSTSGNRDKDWGKEKKFREGQAKQILDNLFFDFIDLAKELQPKVVIAENVKGLLIGNAKKYVMMIYKEFDKAGYFCQHFLLDASYMGVPQYRQRVFFLALRKDIAVNFLKQIDMFTITPEIKLNFNQKKILFSEIKSNENDNPLTDYDLNIWNQRKEIDKDYSDTLKRIENRDSNWSSKYIYDNKVCYTIVSSHGSKLVLFSEPRKLNNNELKLIGSFPLDYDFNNNDVKYIVGMSVPPVMIAQIAKQVYEQWLSKIS
jgi:DNA (cytosine-5)-methyltransferase 1